MKLRMGDLLVDNGVLSSEQVEQALAVQRESGRPFGLVCERLFSIPPEAIEAAWSQQYAQMTPRFDPDFEPVEQRCLELVSRRQAWQFRVLPVRFDGDELVLASSQQHLPRALRFAHHVLGTPSYLVCAEPHKLGEALCRHFPMAGMSPDVIACDRAAASV